MHKEQLYKFDSLKSNLNFKQARQYKFSNEIIIHIKPKLKTEKQRRNGLIIISIIILTVFRFSFFSVKKVQKSKTLVEGQKVVEEKQQEITDSINYAKRLQQGILVPFDLVQSLA